MSNLHYVEGNKFRGVRGELSEIVSDIMPSLQLGYGVDEVSKLEGDGDVQDCCHHSTLQGREKG